MHMWRWRRAVQLRRHQARDRQPGRNRKNGQGVQSEWKRMQGHRKAFADGGHAESVGTEESRNEMEMGWRGVDETCSTGVSAWLGAHNACQKKQGTTGGGWA